MRQLLRYSPILLLLIFLGLTACGDETRGCTDPNSLKYNPEATEDDGSCTYPSAFRTPMLIMFGHTGNSTTGSYAIPIFQQIHDQYGSRLIAFTAFPVADDPLFSGSAVSLNAAMNAGMIPSFAIGSQKDLTKISDIQSAIQQEFSLPVLASAEGKILGLKDDSLEVEYYGVFHEATSGQFFANILLIERNVPTSQAGISTPGFRHPAVLRTSGADNGLGFQIAIGDIPEGHSFRKKFKLGFNHGWIMGNLYAIVAIWKVLPDRMECINARTIQP